MDGTRAPAAPPAGGTPAAATPRRAVPVRVTAIRGERRLPLPDQVVAEEPLEIRVCGPEREPEVLGITMRTPGNDFELAAGFLVSEGVVEDQAELRQVRYCVEGGPAAQRFNVVTVELSGTPDLRGHQRRFTVSSACGVCGTSSLEQLETRCRPLGPGPTLDASLLLSLPDALRSRQPLFEETGGLHGAGLFDVDGQVLAVREDVGRHNAVDKLVGWAALGRRLPLSDTVLVVSGRAGFEIVQKAAVAGVPVVVAVSAPSSLAVDCARRVGMTLVGFVRGERANVYAAPERVTGAAR